MNEQRQELYNQLVNRLIHHPAGEESDLLQANSDLVDLGLFNTIAEAENVLTAQNNTDAATQLHDINHKLLAANGFNSLDEMRNVYYKCLIEILEAVVKKSTPEVVYPVFLRHLNKLNIHLAWILQFWTGKKLLANQEQESLDSITIAEIIFNFATIIQEFPLGDIANYQEIAIMAYELVLYIYTEQDLDRKSVV